jgi:hypothetical protein
MSSKDNSGNVKIGFRNKPGENNESGIANIEVRSRSRSKSRSRSRSRSKKSEVKVEVAVEAKVVSYFE